MNNTNGYPFLIDLPTNLYPDEASPPWMNKEDNGWYVRSKMGCVDSTSLLGIPGFALSQRFLLKQYMGYLPKADYVYYQFVFAAITVILLCGSLLGRMNFYAWMLFVPMWLTLSYTHIIDYAGGFVIHLSYGVTGFTAAYWDKGKQHFPPNNIIHMLGGAGFLWLGWTGFNGRSPFAANVIASLAYTHICTAASLLMWLFIGAVQGMITGLVCITPGAGIVEPWAALIMGAMSGSIPWYTMMMLHRRSAFFQSVDDTLGVFHTHAVAGLLGGTPLGLLWPIRPSPNDAPPLNLRSWLNTGGALFIIWWNAVVRSLICILINRIVDLRMNEEDLNIGDDAAHGEEAYALWGDGEKTSTQIRWQNPRIPSICRCEQHSFVADM
ncbi:unnamed protein product [Malus baccata var. baccata]